MASSHMMRNCSAGRPRKLKPCFWVDTASCNNLICGDRAMPIDYSEYPSDWHAISRRIRVDRAGGRCEWCGALNYHPHPETASSVVPSVAPLNHVKHHVRHENQPALR